MSGAVVRAVTDWSTLFGSNEEKGRILSEIGPAWIRSWQSSGDEQLEKVYRLANRDLDSDMSFGSRDIAGQFLNRMASEIYGTNTKRISKIVEQGLINGLSVDEIADQISTSATFNPSRARLIARTEATRSVNGASIAAYQEAAMDGINVQKRWLTAQDDKVRPEHQELDGQTVAVSDLFTAGAYSIEGPGQFGEADQDCNCRCTVLPIVD